MLSWRLATQALDSTVTFLKYDRLRTGRASRAHRGRVRDSGADGTMISFYSSLSRLRQTL